MRKNAYLLALISLGILIIGCAPVNQKKTIRPRTPDEYNASIQSYWKCDTLDESKVTDTIGSNDGTADNVRIIPGRMGNALAFDGTSDSFVTIDDDAYGIKYSKAFTVSLWVYIDDDAPAYYESIITKHDHLHPFGIRKMDVDTIEAIIRTETGKYTLIAEDLSLNTWHHIVLTYGNHLGKLYIDNTLVETMDTEGMIFISDSAPTTIGNDFSGAVDEVRIFNSALDSWAVNKIYNGEVPPDDFVKPDVSGSYYVDAVRGNDDYPGTKELPFATIQYAEDMSRPGDIIYVNPGNYGRVRIHTDGTAEKKITYRGLNQPQVDFPDGSNARLLNSGSVATVEGFDVYGEHIIIENFEITDIKTGRGAITINDTQQVLIQNNYIHELNCQVYYHSGIIAGGDSITIRDNIFWRVEGIAITFSGTNFLIERNNISHGSNQRWSDKEIIAGDSDAIRFGGTNHLIRYNYIHDYILEETSGTPHMDAFQNHGGDTYFASDIVIDHNIAYNIAGQIVMMADELETAEYDRIHDITFTNNILLKCGAIAIHIYDVKNLIIKNNIIGKSGLSTVLLRRSDEFHTGCTYATVVNNIFYDYYADLPDDERKGQTLGSDCAEGSIWDYNLHSHAFSWPPIGDNDAHGLMGVDPGFVNPDNLLGPDKTPFTADDGYRLRSDSPARSAGQNGEDLGPLD